MKKLFKHLFIYFCVIILLSSCIGCDNLGISENGLSTFENDNSQTFFDSSAEQNSTVNQEINLNFSKKANLIYQSVSISSTQTDFIIEINLGKVFISNDYYGIILKEDEISFNWLDNILYASYSDCSIELSTIQEVNKGYAIVSDNSDLIQWYVTQIENKLFLIFSAENNVIKVYELLNV